MADVLVTSRLITHSFIIILALAAAIASSVSVGATSRGILGGRGFVAHWQGRDRMAAADLSRASLRLPALVRTWLAGDDTDGQREPAALGAGIAVPEDPVVAVKRREVQEYEIAPGDTVSGIAERFGLSTTTLLWSNNLKPSSLLQPGDKLKILPVDGLLHEVKSGDNLSSLAARYQVDVEVITGYPENDLANPDRLVLGRALVIPGATKPAEPPPVLQAAVRAAPAPEPALAPAPVRPASSGFVWPTYGPIFTYFGGYHAGLDISPPYGTPVVAAAGGVVTAVNRWNYSYGYHIIVDHGNGVETLYSHFSEILVGVGETVAQGQLVGRVGSTGRSTGPHLHFEVRRHGAAIDPLGVLPR